MSKRKKLIIPLDQHRNVVLVFQQPIPNGDWICQMSNEYMGDVTKLLEYQGDIEDVEIKA